MLRSCAKTLHMELVRGKLAVIVLKGTRKAKVWMWLEQYILYCLSSADIGPWSYGIESSHIWAWRSVAVGAESHRMVYDMAW